MFGIPGEEDFTHSAWAWFQITIVAVALTMIFFVCGGIVVIMQDTAPAQQQVSQAFAPFFLGAAGIVTFCGAVWRGKLNSEQIKQQTRQNNASDEANFARLLQEGAKLLAEPDKEAHVIAGISTLEILVGDPQRRFAEEAMDLLADLLMKTYGPRGLDKINRSVIRALQKGEDLGIRSRVEGTFVRLPDSDTYRFAWHYVPGFRSLTFKGGRLNSANLDRMAKYIKQLSDVIISDWTYRRGVKCAACKFSNCKVDDITAGALQRNTFDNCDFTAAIIDLGPLDIDEMGPVSGNNYYRFGQAPRTQLGDDLSDLFDTFEELHDLD